VLTVPAKPKVRPKPTRRRRVRRRRKKRRRIRRKRRKRRRIRRKRRRKLYRRKRAKRLLRRRRPVRPPVKRPEPRRIIPPLPAPRPIASKVPVPNIPPAPSRPRPVVRRVPVPRPVARAVDFGPYKLGLFRSIRKQQRYPFMARRMGQEGTVVLLIRVSSTGHLIGTPKVIRSSTYSLLDREAKRMIRAAAPWPAMPSGYQGAPRQFRVRIRFSLDS
jgi:TonB family protein